MNDFYLTVGVVGAVVVLLLLFTRRRRGRVLSLRPLSPYAMLKNQAGQAVESGSRMHVTLGRASLVSAASPTSLAALTVLDAVAKDGCANSTPPLATVGEGTLLPAAQGSLLQAYQNAQDTSGFEPGAALFLANDTDPFPYAGGVTSVIHQDNVSNTVAVGRFGPELALIAVAANRQKLDQVIGTDDPVALAVATAVSKNILVGEELLVAGAYLEGKDSQLASVQVQDILRVIIALALIGTAVFYLFAA